MNMFPRRLNFVRAGLISIVIGDFYAPWLWMHDAGTIFAVLGYIGGALGPVAGIMLVDFYLSRRRNYDLNSFYTKTGDYEYSGGWNPASTDSHRPGPHSRLRRRLRTLARPRRSGFPRRLHLVPRPRGIRPRLRHTDAQREPRTRRTRPGDR